MKIFNISGGMTFDEVHDATAYMNPQPDLRGEWFSFIPHENFEPYEHFSCRIDHKKGVLQICGWTKNITTNPNGAELYALFAWLRSDLESRFGSCKILNGFTTPIPFFRQDNQFMAALAKGERILAAEFHGDYGSKLGDGLQMVQLQAYGRTGDSGNVMVKYFY